MSLRNTKQRDLILSIVNNSYSHPGALDIYNEAVKLIPNISLGTVYRNLNLLIILIGLIILISMHILYV